MENLYEAMVIVDPTQSDEELSATIEQIKAVIARADGQVASAYPVFRRRLAYPLGEHTEGTYVLVYFRGAGAVDALKQDSQISTAILRCMIVRANPQALWLEGPPVSPADARREQQREAAEEAAAAAAEAARETPTEAEHGEPAVAEAAPEDAPEPEEAPAEPEEQADSAEPEEDAPDAASPQEDASS